MIEIAARYPAQSRTLGPRMLPRIGYRAAWHRTVQIGWILLNAPAMVECRRGSLDGGAMTEDDRRLRAASRPGR
jgi:hypothetical protein